MKTIFCTDFNIINNKSDCRCKKIHITFSDYIKVKKIKIYENNTRTISR